MKAMKSQMCPIGTEIQTLVFDKDEFSKSKSISWAKKHDFKFGKVDEKENTYRIRQNSPSGYEKDSFRTITLREGVKAVIGCPINFYKEGGRVKPMRGGKHIHKYSIGDKILTNRFDTRIKDESAKIPFFVSHWSHDKYYVLGDGSHYLSEDELTPATEKDFNDYYGDGASERYKHILYAKGGGVDSHRMYNFLAEDLVQLEKAINENDKEEIEKFFSYWGIHLDKLKTSSNQRMYNFLVEDLGQLEKAINENDKEEIEKFFSYWGIHLGKLKYAKGGGVGDENRLMVKNNNSQIAHHTEEMAKAVEGANHVPAWVVAKVNRAASDLSDATHYLDGTKGEYAKGGGVGVDYNKFLRVKTDEYRKKGYSLIEAIDTAFRDLGLETEGKFEKREFDKVIESNPNVKKAWSQYKKASEIYLKDGYYVNPYQEHLYEEGGKLSTGWCYSIGGF